MDATCGKDGSVTVTCNDCGATVSTTVLPATGNHSYSGGACTVCGAPDPNPPAPDNTVAEGGDEVDGTQNVTNVPPAEEPPADNGGGDAS